MQFLDQMFSVSALLPYDALLKCVVTEVVLFLNQHNYFCGVDHCW